MTLGEKFSTIFENQRRFGPILGRQILNSTLTLCRGLKGRVPKKLVCRLEPCKVKRKVFFSREKKNDKLPKIKPVCVFGVGNYFLDEIDKYPKFI